MTRPDEPDRPNRHQAPTEPRVPARHRRRPSTVVARRTARAATRSGALWGYVFGAFVASTAWSYTSLYKTAQARDALAAAFGDNKATIALFGPAPELQTVGGFTVFKVSMTLTIVGAVWGLLLSSRLLRGEEDAGRWDLLLVGRTTPRGATAQALCGLGAGAAVLWALTATIISVAGLSSRIDIAAGPALFFALALVSPALMFAALGAVTSQLAPTRRRAASYAALVLGASYCLRMVGDASAGLHWLTWASPLGWVENLAPLTADDAGPFVPIVVFTAVLAVTAVVLAGRRDVGIGLLPDRAHAAPRLALLGGQLGLSLRLQRAMAVSWILTLAVVGLLFGAVAKDAGATLSNSSVKEVFDKLGATGGGVQAYLGVAFLMMAVLIGFVAAGQIGAVRDEEVGGRLDQLLARPLSRTRWLVGRLGIGLALVVACGAAGGAFTLDRRRRQPRRHRRRPPRRRRRQRRRPRRALVGRRHAPRRALAPGSRAGGVRRPGVVAPGRARRRNRRGEPLVARHVGLPSHRVSTGRAGRLVGRRHPRGRGAHLRRSGFGRVRTPGPRRRLVVRPTRCRASLAAWTEPRRDP